MKDQTEIIQRCLCGEREAFRLLVEHHQGYAYALAFRLVCDPDEACDIVQETFIRVWKHLPSYRPAIKFTTWLYRIVVNLSYDRLRGRTRERSRLVSLEDPSAAEVAGEAEQEAQMVNRDLAARIRSMAGDLPRAQHAVFVLRDLQDLSVEETAEVLGMSTGAVKTNLCLARRAIRIRMQRLEASETGSHDM